MPEGHRFSEPFDREELRHIRDRARSLSNYGHLRSSIEDKLYEKLFEASDLLDALYAREEAEVAALEAEQEGEG